MSKARAYIDGFNLYYQALKNSPYKWLDVNMLCEQLIPGSSIDHIRYFTANVKARSSNADQPIRQQVYLRALKTLPNLSIHYGRFLTNKKMMLRSDSSEMVEVWKTEEKGSDVNLTAWLIHDAHRNLFDEAILISCDSDFLDAINIIVKDLGKRLTILSPHHHIAHQLKNAATDLRFIKNKHLRCSQFPQNMRDSRGPFYKPPSW